MESRSALAQREAGAGISNRRRELAAVTNTRRELVALDTMTVGRRGGNQGRRLGARQHHVRQAFSPVDERDEVDDRVIEPQLVAAAGGRPRMRAQRWAVAAGSLHCMTAPEIATSRRAFDCQSAPTHR